MTSSFQSRRQMFSQSLGSVLCLFVLLSTLAAPLKSFSQGTGFSLPKASKSVAFPNSFNTDKAFPSVSNGFLVSYSREITAPAAIVLDDIGSGREVTPSFWIPAASKISLHDAAVTADRRSLVLVGSYLPIAGGAEVPFIAMQGLAGGQTSLIKPDGDYVPVRVCAANNGTLWTLGQTEAEVLHLQVLPLPDYQMVRSYSLDGTLQNGFVPRSSQGAGSLALLPLGRSYGTRSGHDLNPAKLSCGDSSVGLFIGSPVYSWSEIDLKSNTLQTWTVPPVSHGSITGLTLLGSNNVYASFAVTSANTRLLTLFRLSFNSDHSGSWVQVADNGGTEQKGFGVLLGRDGSSLVYLRGARTPTNATLYWSTP